MSEAAESLRTDSPVMPDRLKMMNEIARFWDKTSIAVRTLWGPHIHHGYFETDLETPLEAQEKLIVKLASLIAISSQDKILDAGCGMGGSSIYFAKHFRAEVRGITLSPNQADIATRAAANENVGNVNFKVEDALSMTSFADNSFDVVWSLESCEQFYDKALFLKQAMRVLKPGGRLMLATWCSGAEHYEGAEAAAYQKFCDIWQVPYMPTIPYYEKLLREQGFEVQQILNWTPQVEKTWRIALNNLHASSLFKIVKLAGWRALLFKKQVDIMQRGFDRQMVQYGVFTASKPLVNAV